MKQVWKFSLTALGLNMVEMPWQAEVIHVGVQHGTIQLWAICDTENQRRPREFAVIGTGQPIPSGALLKHLGTVQIGDFVWHVFEKWS